MLGTGAVLVTGSRRALAAGVEVLPTLPLSIAVAPLNGRAVADDAWVDAQVAEAQRLMAPHGVSVALFSRRALSETRARLETADDRDALAEHVERDVINVFVVDTMRDVDDPELLRMGVRWRKRSNLSKDYVIVTSGAFASTLCHELGHFLGNGHSTVVDNVMSYKRLVPWRVNFDAHQGARMRQVARRLIAGGKVVPIDALKKRG